MYACPLHAWAALKPTDRRPSQVKKPCGHAEHAHRHAWLVVHANMAGHVQKIVSTAPADPEPPDSPTGSAMWHADEMDSRPSLGFDR